LNSKKTRNPAKRSFFSVIHRADYHEILLNRAKELGVHVLLGSKVDRVDFNTGEVYLYQAAVVKGDVIIGADGKDVALHKPATRGFRIDG
jgi:flavin-dependent dehydrogenase